ESIVNNRKRLFPCSVYTEGEYGLEGLFIGLPVILSRKGMEKIISMKLSPEREQELKNSFAFYRSQIESITF
ncbi:malate dehydrogenase, partial [bacterium]|nr:malate dehydrogenase [bacterium]